MTAWFVYLNIVDYMGSDRPHLPNVPHFFGVPFSIYAWPSPIGLIGFNWFNFVVDVIFIFIFAFVTGVIFRSVSLLIHWAIARRRFS
jgi:hypothetical protein